MEREKGAETAVSEQREVIIPEYFASAQHVDDFPIIVEGRTLHVSKGYLGVLSPTLSTMFFDKRYPEARNGEAKLEDLTLDDVLLFLCWAFEIPDPHSEGKTYGTVGRALGIAMEDIPALLRLADYWNVERLQRHCRQAFCDYVRNAKLEFADAASLLEMLEDEPLNLNEADFTDVVDTIAKSGIHYTDLLRVNISPEFRYRLCSVSYHLRYNWDKARVLEDSYTAGRIVREKGAENEKVAWSGSPDPQGTAATLRAILPEVEAAAVMHGYQNSPAEYKEAWAAMTDQTPNAANFSALLTAVNAKPEKIGYEMACQVYSLLQPIEGNLTAADVFTQRLMLPNSEQLVDQLCETCSDPLDACVSWPWILRLFPMTREYQKLALAFPHIYAISLSSLPPRKSIGLPSTDWGNVLSRGCSPVALMTKDKSTDIDALIAYCAAFQIALSPGHKYGDSEGLTRYQADASTVLRLTRDHMDFYPPPTQDELQALRTSVNLGGPSGELNMVGDDGELYTFASIGALLNTEWRRRRDDFPLSGRRRIRGEWGAALAPKIRQVAVGFVAECQTANIEAIHAAAVAVD